MKGAASDSSRKLVDNLNLESLIWLRTPMTSRPNLQGFYLRVHNYLLLNKRGFGHL